MWCAPRLGAHNDEGLGAAGYTEGEIDALRRQGVIGEEPEAEAAE